MRGYRGTWFALRYGILSGNNLDHLWVNVLYVIYGGILPLVAFISAYGLVQFMKWGRISALIVSLVLLISNLYGAVEFVFILRQLQKAPPEPIPEGAVLIYRSMWPTWIIGLASGLVVLILLQDSVKQLCTRRVDA
jgi:hypothetical protein